MAAGMRLGGHRFSLFTLPLLMLCQFASDNTAGICPEAWEAMEEANQGFLPSYGDDALTRDACSISQSRLL